MKNRTFLWGPTAGLLFIVSFGIAWAQEEGAGVPTSDESAVDSGTVDVASEESTDDADANAASATIEIFNAAIASAIQSDAASGFLGRLEIIRPAVWEAFDMELLARRTIGRLKWRRWSDEQKNQYVETLHLLQAATLADRFTHESDVSFVIDKVTDGPKRTKLVHTRIVRAEDEDVKLNYLLVERDEKWRVFDVYLNSTISEVATRRSDYSTILRQDGYDALVEALNGQIDDLYGRNGETRSVAQAPAGD